MSLTDFSDGTPDYMVEKREDRKVYLKVCHTPFALHRLPAALRPQPSLHPSLRPSLRPFLTPPSLLHPTLHHFS